MKHFDIFVRGKVQGVFFRAAANEKARELGVAGFVKNMPDESVHIQAEGDEDTLDEFVEWCRKGPPAAEVENVNIVEGELGRFKEFRILY